jgi:hypothetical protein
MPSGWDAAFEAATHQRRTHMKLRPLFVILPLFALTQPNAWAANDRDVSQCEFIVDDFAVVTTSAYGAVSNELVTQLLVRPDLNQNVVEAGAYFHFAGKYRKITSHPDGRQTTDEWGEEDESLIVPAQRTIDGQRLKIAFTQNWNTYGSDIGERRLKDFAYYVTIRQGDSDIRYWFKDYGKNLSADAISQTQFPYSDAVFTGGYSSARYLWRDSGSPLFANRSLCIGQ